MLVDTSVRPRRHQTFPQTIGVSLGIGKGELGHIGMGMKYSRFPGPFPIETSPKVVSN